MQKLLKYPVHTTHLSVSVIAFVCCSLYSRKCTIFLKCILTIDLLCLVVPGLELYIVYVISASGYVMQNKRDL